MTVKTIILSVINLQLSAVEKCDFLLLLNFSAFYELAAFIISHMQYDALIDVYCLSLIHI